MLHFSVIYQYLQRTDDDDYHHYDNNYHYDDHDADYGSSDWDDYVDYDYGSGYDDYDEGSAGNLCCVCITFFILPSLADFMCM